MPINFESRSEVTLDDIFAEFEDGSAGTLSEFHSIVATLMAKYGQDAVVELSTHHGSIVANLKYLHEPITSGLSDPNTLGHKDFENESDNGIWENIRTMDPYGKDGGDAELAQLKSRTNNLLSR